LKVIILLIYDKMKNTTLFGFDTGTSIQSGEIKLAFGPKPPLLVK
jgi:hypothetical protein